MATALAAARRLSALSRNSLIKNTGIRSTSILGTASANADNGRSYTSISNSKFNRMNQNYQAFRRNSYQQQRNMSAFLTAYDEHVTERSQMADGIGIAPKPLDPAQTQTLIDEIKAYTGSPDSEEGVRFVDILSNRIPPGVDEAAYVKAGYLSAIAMGDDTSSLVSRELAIQLLGTMQGGYNVGTLVSLLEDPDASIANHAAEQLKRTLLVFDAFYDLEELHKKGVAAATSVLESWADAEWYTSKPTVPEKISVTVFKVTGETNTDDLSPAQDAWSRPDIPLHAVAMLKNARDGIVPEEEGTIGPLKQIDELQSKGLPLAYVGDVVGTGSSRKSATNSVLWFMGDDIPYVPDRKSVV